MREDVRATRDRLDRALRVYFPNDQLPNRVLQVRHSKKEIGRWRECEREREKREKKEISKL